MGAFGRIEALPIELDPWCDRRDLSTIDVSVLGQPRHATPWRISLASGREEMTGDPCFQDCVSLNCVRSTYGTSIVSVCPVYGANCARVTGLTFRVDISHGRPRMRRIGE